MAQKTWAANDVLTAADMNLYASREGGAWTSWSPVVTQSSTPTITINRATYARAGRLIHFGLYVTITSTATGANDVVITMPVTAVSGYSASGFPIGTALLYDSSANQLWDGVLTINTSTTMKIKAPGAGVSYLGSGSFTAALANNDWIQLSGFYEAAS